MRGEEDGDSATNPNTESNQVNLLRRSERLRTYTASEVPRSLCWHWLFIRMRSEPILQPVSEAFVGLSWTTSLIVAQYCMVLEKKRGARLAAPTL